MCARGYVCERVRKRARRRPRHGEDHVQRNVQRLGAVEVPVAGWVGDDAVGDERLRVRAIGILLRAGAPGRFQDLGDDLPLPGHVFDDLLEVRRDDPPSSLDHVLHQLAGIARERIEFETRTLHEGSKLGVRRDPYPVPPGETLGDRDERLHIAARTDDHDHQIQPRRQIRIWPRVAAGNDVHPGTRQPGGGALEDARAVVEIELQAIALHRAHRLQGTQRRDAHALVMQTSLEKCSGHRGDHAFAGFNLRHCISRFGAIPRRRLETAPDVLAVYG